jgi:putative inorganic carbon (HCO3(-)) transporter
LELKTLRNSASLNNLSIGLTEAQKLRWLYIIGGVFITFLGLFIALEQFWFLLVPIVLAVAGVALLKLDWLFLIITLLTPLSINVEDIGGGFGLALPTEPLIFGLMLVFLFRVFYDGHFDKRVMRHPLTIAIFVYLSWILITTITSKEPLVSFKFFLSKLWYIIGFYFVATQIFKNHNNIRKFLWMFSVTLIIVCIYTIIVHASHGFGDKPAHWVMQPFFKDHTSYGAILAMFYPLTWAYLWSKNLTVTTKIIVGVLMTILTLAIILSYTRAAWVSLAGVLVVFIVMIARVRWWIVVMVIISGISVGLTFQDQIMMKLEKNRQDSSDDLAEHVSSISNVATDASNLERINRWSAALRMFEEQPVFGFGPGTYKFYYAPFQHSSQLTVISTNFGNLGNAHSEYFGPLAEMGVLGLLTLLIVIGVAIYKFIIVYYQIQNFEMRLILMSVFLGWITYLVHGVLNNYLDLDKANVPFWGFLGILVAIELYHKDKTDEEISY